LGVCAAIKPNGGRCNAGAMQGSDYCYNHSPDLAAERKRSASKGGKRGGRGRLSAELARLQKRLEELAEQVLRGEVERSLAHTAGVLLTRRSSKSASPSWSGLWRRQSQGGGTARDDGIDHATPKGEGFASRKGVARIRGRLVGPRAEILRASELSWLSWLSEVAASTLS
jgi:hypothetical protein